MNRVVSFKKLWHMLIDRDMNKTDLKRISGISSSTLANMVADRYVSMDVLVRICSALNCDFSDIMEVVPEKTQEKLRKGESTGHSLSR